MVKRKPAVSTDVFDTIRYQSLTVPATREILQGELKDLFDYWTTLRGIRGIPPWSAFEWARVPARLVQQCAVVEVRRHPLDFVYIHWGVGRTIMQGANYTGKSVREFRPKRIAEKAIHEYAEAMTQRTAICVRTERLESDQSPAFDYQFLRLPFSDDGSDVHQILGVGLYDESVMKKAFAFYGTSPRTAIDLDAVIRLLDPDTCRKSRP